MKRLNLSLQIAIIFLIAYLITYALLAIIIVSRLDEIYEHNIFDQLESDAKELASLESIQTGDIDPMFAYISYSTKSNIYETSQNINKFVSESYAELLVNKAVSQTESISRYKNIIDNKKIYYVILNYQHFFRTQSNDTFIILTDETLKRDMVKQTSIQILIACLFAYLLGYLLIFLWINRMVADTKKIANSLQDIGKNHYKAKISTNRKDEIGDLVKSIELMRIKIIDNEKHKQEIIQGVSHDLKTPIAIIQSYAEALEDGIYSAKDVSRITLNQCNRLNSKVKKLLTLTRIGYLDMNSSDFGKTNMETLVNHIAELYKGKSSVIIKTNTDSASFTGDTESWQIVLENLLDNAIRYAKSQITIDLTAKELSIYNDGSNIDEEKVNTIFNAYEKGSNGNYGLGLSIVKRTVNLFGYYITVENLNNGVKFTIRK